MEQLGRPAAADPPQPALVGSAGERDVHGEFVLYVNGERRHVVVDRDTPLLYVLRNELGLTAAKFGCGLEQCYACAVIVDGEIAASCATAVEAFAGKQITTLEGLGAGGCLDPLQKVFLEEQAAQCGYCTSGIILAAKALLDRVPAPSDDQIKAALAAHLCRCGSHPRVLRAVRRAADR
jgi:nicotinate dehydrogenase subunit A